MADNQSANDSITAATTCNPKYTSSSSSHIGKTDTSSSSNSDSSSSGSDTDPSDQTSSNSSSSSSSTSGSDSTDHEEDEQTSLKMAASGTSPGQNRETPLDDDHNDNMVSDGQELQRATPSDLSKPSEQRSSEPSTHSTESTKQNATNSDTIRTSMGNLESGLTETIINSHLTATVTSLANTEVLQGASCQDGLVPDVPAILQDHDVPDLTESLAETLVQNEAAGDGGSRRCEGDCHDSLQELDQADLAALLPEVPSSPPIPNPALLHSVPSAPTEDPELLSDVRNQSPEEQHNLQETDSSLSSSSSSSSSSGSSNEEDGLSTHEEQRRYEDVEEILQASSNVTPSHVDSNSNIITNVNNSEVRQQTNGDAMTSSDHPVGTNASISTRECSVNSSDSSPSGASNTQKTKDGDSWVSVIVSAETNDLTGSKTKTKVVSLLPSDSRGLEFANEKDKRDNVLKNDDGANLPVTRKCGRAQKLRPAMNTLPALGDINQYNVRGVGLESLSHQASVLPNVSPDSGIQSITGSPATVEVGSLPALSTESECEHDGPPVLENMKEAQLEPFTCPEHSEHPVLAPMLEQASSSMKNLISASHFSGAEPKRIGCDNRTSINSQLMSQPKRNGPGRPPIRLLKPGMRPQTSKKKKVPTATLR